MLLREKIANWDGKTIAYLTDIYNLESSDPSFVNQLLELMGEKTLQSAATWLLKHALENRASIDEVQAYRFYDKMDVLTAWQAKLHLLQLMPLLMVPETQKFRLAEFCRSSTVDENKFVRAWGYNGLYELANVYEDFREGLEIVFSAAMETEPASVKARLRDIQKKINANWH